MAKLDGGSGARSNSGPEQVPDLIGATIDGLTAQIQEVLDLVDNLAANGKFPDRDRLVASTGEAASGLVALADIFNVDTLRRRAQSVEQVTAIRNLLPSREEHWPPKVTIACLEANSETLRKRWLLTEGERALESDLAEAFSMKAESLEIARNAGLLDKGCIALEGMVGIMLQAKTTSFNGTTTHSLLTTFEELADILKQEGSQLYPRAHQGLCAKKAQLALFEGNYEQAVDAFYDVFQAASAPHQKCAYGIQCLHTNAKKVGASSQLPEDTVAQIVGFLVENLGKQAQIQTVYRDEILELEDTYPELKAR